MLVVECAGHVVDRSERQAGIVEQRLPLGGRLRSKALIQDLRELLSVRNAL